MSRDNYGRGSHRSSEKSVNDFGDSNGSGCPNCTYINHPDLLYCEMCERPLRIAENDAVSPLPSSSSIHSSSIVLSSSSSMHLSSMLSSCESNVGVEQLAQPTSKSADTSMDDSDINRDGNICSGIDMAIEISHVGKASPKDVEQRRGSGQSHQTIDSLQSLVPTSIISDSVSSSGDFAVDNCSGIVEKPFQLSTESSLVDEKDTVIMNGQSVKCITSGMYSDNSIADSRVSVTLYGAIEKDSLRGPTMIVEILDEDLSDHGQPLATTLTKKPLPLEMLKKESIHGFGATNANSINGAVGGVAVDANANMNNCSNDSAAYTSGLIELMTTALKAEGARFRLCSPCFHVTQSGFEGAKWACGFRNLQMLVLSLVKRPEYRKVLFAGKGDIPDVHGLQSWIEKAWLDGFDPVGCDELGGSLLGSTKWIGSAECAALLRYFGIRACIVEFFPSKSYFLESSQPVQKGKSKGVDQQAAKPAGTISYYFGNKEASSAEIQTAPVHVDADGWEVLPVELISESGTTISISDGTAVPSRSQQPYGLNSNYSKGAGFAAASSDVLGKRSRTAPTYFGSFVCGDDFDDFESVDGISATYSSDDDSASRRKTASRKKQSSKGADLSKKTAPRNELADRVGRWIVKYFDSKSDYLPPLYLQHEGHSRTVVGYELDSQDQVHLLMFDPMENGKVLHRHLVQCLETQSRDWKKRIKRGLHTLKNSGYEIMFIQPGIMSPRERLEAKILSGTSEDTIIREFDDGYSKPVHID